MVRDGIVDGSVFWRTCVHLFIYLTDSGNSGTDGFSNRPSTIYRDIFF